MFSSRVYSKLFQLLSSQPCFWHHTANCMRTNTGTPTRLHPYIATLTHTAHISCVVTIFLLRLFSTCHANFASIYNDNAISPVDVGCKSRLVFATQNFGNFTRKTP